MNEVKKMSKIACIIGHGDFDGVISGSMKYIQEIPNYGIIEIWWSQPYWLADSRYTGDLNIYDKIFIVDIALNNRDIISVLKFIQKYKAKLLWYDHHYGWDNNIHKTTDFDCRIDTRCKSCVNLIEKVHPYHYTEKMKELVKLAHLTDQGKALDNIYHKALKINPKNNESRYEIFRYATSLEGGELERQSLASIKRKANYYDRTMKVNTEKVLKDSKIIKNIMFVDLRRHRRLPIDKTLLFFLAYEKVSHVVLKYYSRDNQNCMTVATKTRLNLLDLFKQKSGQRYRITLFRPKYNDSQIINLLGR